MIVSASRRTDLPAFYSAWLLRRLREGFCLVRNPYDARRLRRVPLTPDIVDCIVFWTRDPRPLLPHLREIEALGHAFYFQFTLNAYGAALEPHAPPLAQAVAAFRRLSEIVGPQRVVWRYDPILLDGRYAEDFHLRAYRELAAALAGCASHCVVSFVDAYAKLGGRFREVSAAEMRSLAKGLARVASAYGFSLATCAEAEDLADCGLARGACIDRARIEALLGARLGGAAQKSRAHCQCLESVDIGAYDSCLHGCAYCYATRSLAYAQRRHAAHDPASPLLIGRPGDGEAVVPYQIGSLKSRQGTLFS